MYIPTIHISIILYYLPVVDDYLIFPVVSDRSIKETVVYYNNNYTHVFESCLDTYRIFYKVNFSFVVINSI